MKFNQRGNPEKNKAQNDAQQKEKNTGNTFPIDNKRLIF